MNDQMILDLKAKGKSLRQIATELGVTHVAVLKRLRAMEGNRQVVTGKDRKRLPAIIEGKDKQATGSIPHPSRLCYEIKDGGNQVVTKKTPSLLLSESVNPSETSSDRPTEAKKGVYQRVDSESGDLFKEIKDFLEANGIEVYRMNVEQEAYQVTDGKQVVRFYVSHRDKGDMKR